MSDDEAFNAALDRLAAQMNEPEVKEWLAIRRAAGRNLDPETAEVTCWYAQTTDPYGVCTELPQELDCVGKEYFARSPGSGIWVSFDDLPKAAVERLRQRIEAGDFDKSAVREQESDGLAALTFEQAREEVQFALRLQLDTSDIVIEELSRLPDGRIQFIAREVRPRSD